MFLKFLISTIIFLFLGSNPVFAGDPPTLANPSNNATVTSSKVEWLTPSYQLYSSNPYRVQVDNESSFPSSTIDKDYYTDNTSYTPVLALETWYWRVKAKDISGTWSNWSNVWSFILTSSTPSPTPSPASSPSSSSSSFSISNIPSEINSDQSFTASVNLVLPNNPSSKFYLKGAFKKSDGSNYFGLTKVNSSWIKNSNSYSDQYPITTDSTGNWSGNLEVQVDAFDSGYVGSGDYIFKIARYTSSGSGPVWSNEQTIKINAKEVSPEEKDEEIGVINLSKVSASPKSEVLAVSQEYEDKVEEPYSLEKYQKVSTQTAVPLSKEEIKVKSKRSVNLFIIIGGIFILVALGYLVYRHYRFRLKSMLDEIHKLF